METDDEINVTSPSANGAQNDRTNHHRSNGIEASTTSSPNKKWFYLGVVTLIQVIVVLAIVLPITLTRRNKGHHPAPTPYPTPTFDNSFYAPVSPSPTIASEVGANFPVTLQQVGQEIQFECDGCSSQGVTLASSSDGQVVITVAAAQNVSTSYNTNTLFSIQAYSLDNATNSWIAKGSAVDGIESSGVTGIAASSDGNTVVVGLSNYYNDAQSEFQNGRALVFSFDSSSSSWLQMGSSIVSNNTESLSGTVSAVAISSDGMIVAVGDTVKNAVRAFRFDGEEWVQIGATLFGRVTSVGQFGSSVALSDDGRVLAAGASGFVQLFFLDYSGWEISTFFFDNSVNDSTFYTDYEASDFGNSVAISGDGSILAISNFDTQVQVFSLFERPVDAGSGWESTVVELNNTDIFFFDKLTLSSDGTILAVPSESGTEVFAFHGAGWHKIGATSFSSTSYNMALSKDGATIVESFSVTASQSVVRVSRAQKRRSLQD
jgi:hypothetical protein